MYLDCLRDNGIKVSLQDPQTTLMRTILPRPTAIRMLVSEWYVDLLRPGIPYGLEGYAVWSTVLHLGLEELKERNMGSASNLRTREEIDAMSELSIAREFSKRLSRLLGETSKDTSSPKLVTDGCTILPEVPVVATDLWFKGLDSISVDYELNRFSTAENGLLSTFGESVTYFRRKDGSLVFALADERALFREYLRNSIAATLESHSITAFGSSDDRSGVLLLDLEARPNLFWLTLSFRRLTVLKDAPLGAYWSVWTRQTAVRRSENGDVNRARLREAVDMMALRFVDAYKGSKLITNK